MTLTVNGQPVQLPPGATVADLLAHLKLADQPAAVEVNQALVPKRRHAQHALAEGDRVEVVTLVGGG